MPAVEYIENYLMRKIPQLSFYPIVLGSVLKKRGFENLKKEAQKLNAEMNALGNSEGGSAAAAASINAETAEQLLFQSAGLSLIILPEHDVQT